MVSIAISLIVFYITRRSKIWTETAEETCKNADLKAAQVISQAQFTAEQVLEKTARPRKEKANKPREKKTTIAEDKYKADDYKKEVASLEKESTILAIAKKAKIEAGQKQPAFTKIGWVEIIQTIADAERSKVQKKKDTADLPIAKKIEEETGKKQFSFKKIGWVEIIQAIADAERTNPQRKKDEDI